MYILDFLTNLVRGSQLDSVQKGDEVEVGGKELDRGGEAHPQHDRSVVVRQRGKPQDRERGDERDRHGNSDRNLRVFEITKV